MIKTVYRVYKDEVNQGYWFKYGGILQENPPPAPMEIIERDYNYVSCTETPEQDMLYFPKEFIEKNGGKFGVFEVDEKYIRALGGDCVSADGYLSFDYRYGKLIARYTYDEFEEYAKNLREKGENK
jgi:hypothetical protein